MARPAVPSPGGLSPAFEYIESGAAIVRVFERRFGPLVFNPTDAVARFRPVRDVSGQVVPTAYAARDQETAIAETILRGVSALNRGTPRRRLFRTEVAGLDMVTLRTTRRLQLARLHGLGLLRLQLLREHIIDCPESEYDYTADWAQALYATRRRPHGLSWTSRENDSSRAYMLWGGSRVRSGWLTQDSDTVALDRDPGLDLVRQVCADAGIDFEA
jgi:hypothetical protein